MAESDVRSRCPDGAVVAGIDGSAHTAEVLSEAARLAGLEKRPLHVVHVIDRGRLRIPGVGDVAAVRELGRSMTRSGDDLLRAAGRRAASQLGPAAVTTELVAGDPREVLVAESRKATLTVVGARGRGTIRTMRLGSVVSWVSWRAASPVILTRPRAAGMDYAGVAVGADGTEASAPALRFAYRLAALRGMPLTVVHSFEDVNRAGCCQGAGDDPDRHRREMAEALAGFTEDFPDVSMRLELVRGRAGVVLSYLSPPPAVLVLGARHRSAFDAVLDGSVSRAVAGNVASTVAVVAAPKAAWVPPQTGSSEAVTTGL